MAAIALMLFIPMSTPLQADDVSKTLRSSMIWSPAAPAGTQAYVAFRKS
jgi:hypothetical protein